MSKRHGHRRNCNECDRKHCHDENNVLSRQSLDHHDGDCVKVCGDYHASRHDKVIIVYAERNDSGALEPSTVHLACPDHIDDCHPVTVVAVDATVTVEGLENEEQGGTGSTTVLAGQEGRFRALHPRDKCRDECPFYTVCICGVPITPPTPA